jgi:DNA-binding NtrC family response regulator
MEQGSHPVPARIVVVLREPVLAGKTAEALVQAGYHAISIPTAMRALMALEEARDIELLITSAHFPGRQPNGLALARMTRQRRPELKVIFANGPDTQPFVRHDGAFIPTPTSPDSIVELADKMMRNLT